MSSLINPEAGQPSGVQGFQQSDRNPMVAEWGGTDSGGGQISTPAPSESRMTPAGASVSLSSGLQNYNVGDNGNSVEDEAERER